MSHIDELRAIHKEMEEDMAMETTEEVMEKEVQEQEVEKQRTILDLIIEESDGVLTEEMVESWKENYLNKVYAIRFEKDDAYIFRYVSRIEWKQIISKLNAMKSQMRTEEYLNEMLFDKCVLYPKITSDFKAAIGAGTIDTVAEQIKIQSNYIPTDIAVGMVQKL